MIDSSSVTLTNEQHTSKKTPPAPGSSTPPTNKKKEQKWYHKFARSEPERPGHEKWRDASLSDKERWKEWHKAKDREQKAGYIASCRYPEPILMTRVEV
jgi:hypothetical protein